MTIIDDERYRTEYARLNGPQRQAVDAIDGPVMVVAGPGTGKTQVLALRIATILRQTDAAPENILCLTFTDAGAVAMRNRLVGFMGAEAYKVVISTFHAFCNMVIQDRHEYFGLRELTPVSELERREILREVVLAFTPDNPLFRYKGDLLADGERLLKLFQIMKQEDWTSELLIREADGQVALLPDQEGMRYKRKYTAKDGTVYQPGDLKQKEYEAAVLRMETLKAAACAFDEYQARTKERGRYDFDDMILRVVAAFRDNPDLLADYQERFQYILADEYQDTSGSQNEILELLTDYWESPNLFVVGDDDQSIFRFQGASIENILGFAERYHPQVICLTDNYRSTQAILDGAGQVIDHSSQRLTAALGISKQLTAASAVSPADAPQVREYPTPLQEAAAIGQEVEALIAGGMPPGEIAIIYRNHRQAEPLVQYFQQRRIPVAIRRREDILCTPLVGQLLSVLHYLAAELVTPHRGEGELFRLLHLPWSGLTSLEIASLLESTKDHRREPLRVLLAGHHDDRFRQASALIETMIAQGVRVTLLELIHQAATRFGILSLALGGEAPFRGMEQLNGFFNFVQDELEREPRLTLEHLLTKIELMGTSGLELPSECLEEGEGVQFLTAHGAKGLEFAQVFMLGCTAAVWDSVRQQLPFTLPPSLQPRGQAGKDLRLEESRRLFFVAMTRAKQRLIISYPRFGLTGKEQQMSGFAAELLAGHAPVACGCEAERQLQFWQTGAAWIPAIPADILLSSQVDRLLESYTLSVTHLNHYLACPVAFFYVHLLKVPSPPTAALAFGTAVHEALFLLFREMLEKGHGAYPSAERLVELFDRRMEREAGAFTPDEYQRRLVAGHDILPRFYQHYRGSWPATPEVEKGFRALVAGVPITGKLDRLDPVGDRVRVIDYKTGSSQRAKQKLHPPAGIVEPGIPADPGGDYWRQAAFYKVLVEQGSNGEQWVDEVEFVFVEPDRTTSRFETVRVPLEATDVAQVTAQAVAVYRAIMDRQFTQGCGKQECDWCRFVATGLIPEKSPLTRGTEEDYV